MDIDQIRVGDLGLNNSSGSALLTTGLTACITVVIVAVRIMAWMRNGIFLEV